MRCIVCRQDLHNLNTREKLAMVRTELFMNESTKRPQSKTKINPLDMSEICWIS